ncbi:unnamed protein product [Symbiodinium natans]|uniref:Uncharacterized protein n=1 Tax=Symbiodinium natans TaxID=878477 RepID=A0A812PBA4_9DINO|nr:unnamed protein product [Symbiodinium natans]
MWTACGATSSLAPPPHAAALQVHAGGHVGSVGEYVSVCHVHGMAVAVPHRAEKMLAVDPSRGQTSTIDLPVNEVLVAVPLDAGKILVLNPSTGQSQSIDLPSGIDASMPRKFGSICNVNGRAVAAPSGAEKILVVEPADGQVSAIELPASIDASKCCKYLSVCNVNRKAVMAPCNAEKILVVDPEASQAWAIDLPFGLDARTEWKYFSWRRHSIYDKILVVDPATSKAQARDLPAGIDASRCHKYCSISVASGRAVAVPWNAKRILVLDPATGHASAIDLPAGIDASRGRKFLCACAVNGKAVAVPSGAEKVLVVDPVHGQASARDLPAGIDASRPRKYESLVAALVSYWVHTDEQEPPQIEHAAMHAHLELLSEAKKHRTWRIIFTGHSLGGMYAADFAQKRAINYINANDPCSRAWGAINLRSFVDLAAQGVENGLVGGLRSIDGLVASQAVTAAARQLLSRQEISAFRGAEGSEPTEPVLSLESLLAHPRQPP